MREKGILFVKENENVYHLIDRNDSNTIFDKVKLVNKSIEGDKLTLTYEKEYNKYNYDTRAYEVIKEQTTLTLDLNNGIYLYKE